MKIPSYCCCSYVVKGIQFNCILIAFLKYFHSNSLLEEEHNELLDSYLLKGLYDTKVANATMRSFKSELTLRQQLIKSAAKLILQDSVIKLDNLPIFKFH
jgi:hypothetical protein